MRHILAAVAALLTLTTLAIPARAQGTGSISGQILDPNGAPLANRAVTLHLGHASYTYSFTTTNALGVFTFSSLPEGTYYLVSPEVSSSPYVPQIYGTTCPIWRCTYRDGSPIVLSAGEARGGIEIRLRTGGSVSGQLYDATTGGLVPMNTTYTMRLYDEFGHSLATQYLQAQPTYSFEHLPPGRYNLLVETFPTSQYASEFADGRHCAPACAVTAGTPFEVVDGGAHTLNITLDRAGRISGRLLSAATGTTFGSGQVLIRSLDGSFTSTFGVGSDGTYDAIVPPGQYTVLGTTFSNTMAPEFYGGIPALCDVDMTNPDGCALLRRVATPVIVTAGVTRSGVDITMDAAGSIAGSLTVAGPLSASLTIAVLTPGGVVVDQLFTSAPGNYQLQALTAGTYYVCASAFGSFRTQAYGGAEFDGPACPPSAGTPIVIAPGAVKSDINFTLQPLRASGHTTGTLSGRVTAVTGQGLPGVVRVFAEAGTSETSDITDSIGLYSLNLSPGRYFVRTEAYGNFVDEWYGNVCAACSDSRGLLVTIEPGVTRTLNFDLEPGASIQGTISSGPSIVAAYDASGRLIRYGYSDISAPEAYSIDSLPPGNYYVRTTTTTSAFVADVIYPSVPCLSHTCDVTAGTPISLVAGQSVTGINLTMPAAGTIRGRAVARDGWRDRFGAPTSFTVEAFDVTGQPAGRFVSFSGAYYEIGGLIPGVYYVRTSDGGKAGMVDEAWRDVRCSACPITEATPITVSANAYTDHIDLALSPGGAIAGVVVESGTGAPLDNQRIEVRTLGGTLVASSSTTFDGSYKVDGLADGQYYVQTVSSLGYLDQRYHRIPCAMCSADRGLAVPVTAPATTGGVNFALVKGARVSGRVKGGDAGIAGVRVSVLNAGGEIVGTTVSDAAGTFVASAPAETVFARVEPSGYLAQLFDRRTCTTGACDLGTATPLALQVGQFRTGVDFPLMACQMPAIHPAALPSTIVSHPYSHMLTASGTMGPYRFGLRNGSLPPGLALNTATGVLAGTITQAGSFTFTVGAMDAAGCSTAKALSLEVKTCDVALSAQHVSFQTGGGTKTIQVSTSCPWQVSTVDSWITVSASASSVTLTVASNPGETRYGRVTVGGQSIAVSQASLTSGLPFGALDVPNNGVTVRGSIAVGGWALDDVEVQRIAIYRDAVAPEPAGQPIYIGDAVRVRGARPDVEALFPHMPLRDRAGWGFLLLTNMLPGGGNGTFRLHAVAIDLEGHSVQLGSRTIVAANAGATLPFGAIDTPAQGETISGSAYINFGWALTPVPKTIPLNGSTITVFVDGVSHGTVDYNHYRADVATLFPGRHNSNGAVGFKTLDTTQLANGIHTISWTVTDNAGATEGIGSRYFHVDNLSSPVTAATVDDVQPVSREMPAAVDLSGTTSTVIRVREMERIAFDLRDIFKTQTCISSYRGSEIVGDERRPLPAGSSLDSTSGAFAWQPGPGFLGLYRLFFTAIGCDGRESAAPIDVRILRAAR